MQATYEDLSILLEIQDVDLEVMRAKKQRAELPQRIQVVKVRKKREEILPKLDQVKELQEQAEAEITAVEDEDRGLKEKQERAQEIINAAGSDFRKAESHSKEMAGVAKRRVTLEETLIELTAKLDKIKGVRAQLEGAISTCNAEEQRLRESYQAQDGQLVEKVRELLAKRAEMSALLPADLVELYDRTAQKTGGVAIGKLDAESGTCGVCRSVIDGGHLIALKSEAPLGTCPSCKRLLIVE